MDKLRCDICGGILVVQPGGSTVMCDSCGMTYSLERMREKVSRLTSPMRVYPHQSPVRSQRPRLCPIRAKSESRGQAV